MTLTTMILLWHGQTALSAGSGSPGRLPPGGESFADVALRVGAASLRSFNDTAHLRDT